MFLKKRLSERIAAVYLQAQEACKTTGQGEIARILRAELPATGHGMLGLTQGPITGKLIADALVDGRTSEELAPLRPERFGNSG